MNKTFNTVLFTLGATLLNLVLILFFFVSLVFLFRFVLNEDSSGQMVTLAYGFSILISIMGGFFCYNRIIKWVNNRWHLEEYLITSFKKR